MATLEIDIVKKSNGNMDVLKEVSISVGDGDFLVLLGPSGCGTSTRLSMIAGLEEITSGEIRIGGDVVNGCWGQAYACSQGRQSRSLRCEH